MNDSDSTESQDPSFLSRRGVLKCMAWAGSSVVWTMSGGVASSLLAGTARAASAGELTFVQISDSHIGFNKQANPDPMVTLNATIAQIKGLPLKPSFVIHTGDITHLAKAEQFDTAQQVFSQIGVPVFYVPGEHDIVDGNNPKPYIERFAKNSKGSGWYSFDANGVHFVALVNSMTLRDSGMGSLGEDQLAWLKEDLKGKSASTPIVVYTHFPMWALYEQWGWGTTDSLQAMALLQRFGSVTVLNGHIHQIQQKVEGNVTFHSARSTAYPQPPPGQGAGPGPLVLPSDQLRSNLGLSTISVRVGKGLLAVTDSTLA
jgi:Icc protein